MSTNVFQAVADAEQRFGNFFSTKRFGPISTGHRQPKAKNHCSFIHGYGRIVEITFGCKALDDKGWAVDFGDLRDVKAFLEGQWDHRTLIADDDPKLELLQKMHHEGLININVMTAPYGPGIEKSCLFVMDEVDQIIRSRYGDRCWVESVQIWEHENNSAILRRSNDIQTKS